MSRFEVGGVRLYVSMMNKEVYPLIIPVTYGALSFCWYRLKDIVRATGTSVLCFSNISFSRLA